jgi:SAM-dependent methyltransferase
MSHAANAAIFVMSRFDTTQVRSYYDRHTDAFVSRGHGKDVGAIHRAVWAPDVPDRRRAFHYVDDQIARLATALPAAAGGPHIVDLGCGVAGSLRYLARQLPIRGTGVTVSPVQVALARQQLASAGLADRIVCVEADFNDLPESIEPADLAYAIESFVHARSASQFFDQCARLIKPGGVLVICDDFRARPGGTAAGHAAEPARRAAERAVEEFRNGWHVNTLVSTGELRELAVAAGFTHESTQDLTPYLELHRWRDRAIGVMLWAMKATRMDRRRVDDLVGGHALQKCLKHGWIRYELVVFRRS